MHLKNHILALLCSVTIGLVAHGQSDSNRTDPTKTDTLIGSLTPERKWWDVQRYDLSIQPDLITKKISGVNQITYKVIDKRFRVMQLDLIKPLKIDSIYQKDQKLPFENIGNIYYVTTQSNRGINKITVYFSGSPKESLNPPWDGGTVWAKDALGRPWISVACQYMGASVWFPCKNALYDEPDDGASVSVRVADTLQAIANGRLLQKVRNMDKTVTFKWSVVNPINHYGICYYIGKYVPINYSYKGEKGLLSMDFWVLDYNKRKAEDHLIPEVVQTMRSLERWFGPYPFYEDGFKIVDASYIGMEHQSAIAYGNNYTKGTYKGRDISGTGWGKKTDRIVVHEMAHEWFGNSITASDIADRWIQEGFAGLGEQLVISDLCGKTAGDEFLSGRLRHLENDKPVIGRYGINEDGSTDNYLKGWAVLDMVREMINDDKVFLKILRGLNKDFYHRTATSAEIESYISGKSGIRFNELFDQYLRTAEIPDLEYKSEGDTLSYRFANCNKNFSVPVRTNWTNRVWIYPTTSWQTIKVASSSLNSPLKLAGNLINLVQKQ